MRITIEDGELSGSLKVSSEIGRAILKILTELEDKKLPKSFEVKRVTEQDDLNYIRRHFHYSGQPLDWRDWAKGGR